MDVLRVSSWILFVLVRIVPVLTDSASALPQRDAVNVTLHNLVITVTRDASCCGRCNEAMSNDYPTCYCDEYCLIYRDCCLDFELYCTDLEQRLVQRGYNGLLETVGNCSSGPVTQTTTITEDVLFDDTESDRTVCPVWDPEHSGSFATEYACKLEALWVPVILARKSNTSFVYVQNHLKYILVQECSNDVSTNEVVDLCLNWSGFFETLNDVRLVVPVTASDGLHYRNIYCARCNGFQDEEVQFWQVKLNCPSEVESIGLTDSSVGKCSVESLVEPLSFKWRAAQPRIVPFDENSLSCDSSFPRQFKEACEAYRLGTPYAKNPHCNSFCLSVVNPIDVLGPTTIPFLSISALFDFTSHQDLRFSLGNQPPVLVCDQHEFVDIALGSCRKFHCPSGQGLGPHGTCVETDTRQNPCLLSDPKEQQLVSLVMDFQTEAEDIDLVQQYMFNFTRDLLNVTVRSLRLSFCQNAQPVADIFSPSTPCQVNVIAESPHSFEAILFHYLAKMRQFPLYNTLDSIFVIEKLTLDNFDYGFLVDRCGRLGQIPVSYSLGVDFTKFEFNETQFVGITVDNRTITCPSESTYQEVVFRPPLQVGHSDKYLYMCQQKLKCALVIINSSEITWLDNTTLLLASVGNLSSDDVIKLSDEEFVVCRPPGCVNCTRPYFLEDAVFSLVCIIASLLFLLLTLLNFCVFPELCTLPGKNLICFILALFLTQMVFLIGPGSPLSQFTVACEDACLAFAVLIHYLLLAAFFWTNVVSLHFARTFGFKLRMRHQRFHRAFMWYSLYGWGAPALISATGCVIHHLLIVDGVNVLIYQYCIPFGYGALFLVAAPISLIMSSNAVFFVLTVVGIRRTRKSTSLAKTDQSQQERLKSEFALGVKIFVATGMTWIVIFILGHFKVDGFSHLFTVLISLQGPLLFFSFALTERIRCMWKARFPCLRRSSDKVSKGTGSSLLSSVTGTSPEPSKATGMGTMLLDDKDTEDVHQMELSGHKESKV